MTRSPSMQRVDRAIAQLLMNTSSTEQAAPFFASLAMSMAILPATDCPVDCDTACTNGKAIWFNEQYVDSLKPSELRGLIAHEVMHPASGHHVRRGNRDPEGWNDAADYEINLPLVDMGFTLPQGALLNRNYASLSAEAIYAKGQRQQGNTPKGFGKVIDAPGDKELAEAEWKARTISTANIVAKAMKAKGHGELPGMLQRLVETARTPVKANWREQLSSFVDRSMGKRPSWARVNRRFIAQGVYAQGKVSDSAAHMLIVVDDSGSIDDRALAEFSTEANDILNCGIVEMVTVINCDTALRGEKEYELGDTISLSSLGGGGTSFAPAMEWARGKDAACLIYFTDLACYRYGTDPGIPVLWATWASSYNPPPFGTVLEIDAYDR